MCALIGLNRIMSLTNQSFLTEEHYHEVHLKHTDRKISSNNGFTLGQTFSPICSFCMCAKRNTKP